MYFYRLIFTHFYWAHNSEKGVNLLTFPEVENNCLGDLAYSYWGVEICSICICGMKICLPCSLTRLKKYGNTSIFILVVKILISVWYVRGMPVKRGFIICILTA